MSRTGWQHCSRSASRGAKFRHHQFNVSYSCLRRDSAERLEPLSVPAFGMIMGQKAISGSPVGSPTAIDRMLEFSARHSVAPVVETFPMSKVNDALEHLRSGKARYRIVLTNPG